MTSPLPEAPKSRFVGDTEYIKMEKWNFSNAGLYHKQFSMKLITGKF